MTPNPAKEALTRAVNRAIAEGAPVYENLTLENMTWDKWQKLPLATREKIRDNSDLSPQLMLQWASR